MKRLLLTLSIVDEKYNVVADDEFHPNTASVELCGDNIGGYLYSRMIQNLEYSILNILQSEACRRFIHEQENQIVVREEYLQVDVGKVYPELRRVLPVPSHLYNRTQTKEKYIPRDLYTKIRALKTEIEDVDARCRKCESKKRHY